MNHLRVAIMLLVLVAARIVAADNVPEPTREESITAAAIENRLRLDLDEGVFSGPAYEKLVAEGRGAQFFLVGEEHGIAENPQLVGQLFTKLAQYGYSKFAIEISPTMASLLDAALAKDGLDGLRELFAQPGGEAAFFGMDEEAHMLAVVRAAAPAGEPVLWGTDYEIAGDRQLLTLLEQADKPPAAAAALDAVIEASAASWKRYEETGSPQFIFSFAGDPALVRAVSEAWPDPDPRSAVILNTLETTLAVNRLWVEGRAWESNAARAALQRANFLRHWHAEKQRGNTPKVMAKFGASHMVRGLSQTAVYDLGTLLPEIAALEGGHSVSVLVVPGAGALVAVLNPSTWTYEPRSPKDGYLRGLEPLLDAAYEDAFTLIDLAALRPVIGMHRKDLQEELFRVVHGYDLLLVMSGSTASAEFRHDRP